LIFEYALISLYEPTSRTAWDSNPIHSQSLSHKGRPKIKPNSAVRPWLTAQRNVVGPMDGDAWRT